MQQVAAGEGHDGEPLLQAEQLDELLPLLLPGASNQQLEYAAAVLQPFNNGVGVGAATTLDEVAAAAERCATVERSLRHQPAAEATRCLRQLAAALGSRSLDLAAAFAAADGQRLPLAQLVRGLRVGRADPWLRAAAACRRRALALPGLGLITCSACPLMSRDRCCSVCIRR